ncbi:MAG: GNAT family N-acetyltransferase [Anaerolineales bacterium]|nr:GNAT family N-acetyltransferase [Anaerolineales bacterium]
MFIVRVTAVTDELVSAFERLIPHLKLASPPPTREELEALISANSSILLIARYPDEQADIVGMLALIVYRVPTGIRARIEDVVVDEAMRGKGIGEALVRRALNMARDAGADGVALTSNPKREAANRLYQRLGFKPWRTNLYFYRF